MIFWPRETATLLKSNLRYFHREKSTFEKFDVGLKLRIVFYTHKTIKNRRKNFRVIYTLNVFIKCFFPVSFMFCLDILKWKAFLIKPTVCSISIIDVTIDERN